MESILAIFCLKVSVSVSVKSCIGASLINSPTGMQSIYL